MYTWENPDAARPVYLLFDGDRYVGRVKPLPAGFSAEFQADPDSLPAKFPRPIAIRPDLESAKAALIAYWETWQVEHHA